VLLVKPSSIKNSGLGVFLSKNATTIKAGTVLTVYGTHDEQVCIPSSCCFLKRCAVILYMLVRGQR
jgi:hypothetical protein